VVSTVGVGVGSNLEPPVQATAPQISSIESKNQYNLFHSLPSKLRKPQQVIVCKRDHNNVVSFISN